MNDIFNKLKKVFHTFENYNCFVCSSSNPIGLKLDIKFSDNSAYSNFNLSNLYSGFPSIIHGGIQASIIDEIGFWGMFNVRKQIGFTQKLEIDYMSKIETDVNLKVVGKEVSLIDKTSRVEVSIFHDSKLKTKGLVTYKLISDSAIKKFFGEDFYTEFIRSFRND